VSKFRRVSRVIAEPCILERDPMSKSQAPSDRTRIRRIPARGNYDKDQINAILDEALICHVGLVSGDQPFVIPTIHMRLGEELFIHGSAASRMLEHAGAGARLCVTVTLMDGVVLARSAFHHSMNYRSVVVLAAARVVSDREEKRRVLEALVNRFSPGRSEHVRGPNEIELKATTLLALPIAEASAKIRTGGPVDDEEDLSLPVWAGVIPIQLQTTPPQVAEPSAPGAEVPVLGFPFGTPRSV
jgi:nitroimidazol reductase NimA-like FMN-containing flavoprotein (pyridoxamine 5'-phosphate oxidase superfamily)